MDNFWAVNFWASDFWAVDFWAGTPAAADGFWIVRARRRRG